MRLKLIYIARNGHKFSIASIRIIQPARWISSNGTYTFCRKLTHFPGTDRLSPHPPDGKHFNCVTHSPFSFSSLPGDSENEIRILRIVGLLGRATCKLLLEILLFAFDYYNLIRNDCNSAE